MLDVDVDDWVDVDVDVLLDVDVDDWLDVDVESVFVCMLSLMFEFPHQYINAYNCVHNA